MIRYDLALKLIDPELNITIKSDWTKSSCYNPTENCIILGLDSSWDMGFRRHILEVHGYKDVYKYTMLTWSLLHEIGHHYTLANSDLDLYTRSICALFSVEDFWTQPEVQDLYYNIDSEYTATEWAIMWIKTNPYKVNLLDKIMREAANE